MQKVILDTNVLVSALIQRSYPYLIIDALFIDQQMQLCVSGPLMAEYYAVLARPKFARFLDFFARAESLLVAIETHARHYTSTITLDFISDKDDNRILELAHPSEAAFIVTGNPTDFTMETYLQTRIVTPKEYWKQHRPR